MVDTVKSEHQSRPPVLFGSHPLGLLTLLGVTFTHTTALSDSLLLPEPRPAALAPHQAGIARAEGRFRGLVEGLRAPPPSRPSPRFPVAVREEARSLGEDPLRLLERAYRLLVHGLNLPSPRPVLWQLEQGKDELRVTVVPSLLSPFDSGAVVCRSGALEVSLRTAVLCVAEGIAAHLDAAETASLRRAYALLSWWSLGWAEDRDHHLRAVAEQRAAAGPFATDPSGAALAQFFMALESTLGKRQPPELLTGLLATAVQKTSEESATFQNEPDVLDGLHAAFDDSPARFAEGMTTQAIERILARSVEGASTVPAPDHQLLVSSLPRRVAWRQPLGPLGFAHLRIDLDHRVSPTPLGFAFDSEPPSPFCYTIVKLDEEGAPCGRLDTAFEPYQTHIEKNLHEFADAQSLLVIGVNLGLGPAESRFDPDLGPRTAHQALIHVFLQPPL